MFQVASAWAVVPPFTSLKLAWDKVVSHDASISFELQWGSSTNATSTNYYNNALNVGTNTTCVVTNPTTGFLYFRAVAVHTVTGIKSEPSNIVSETNYPAKPLLLRIETNTTSKVRIDGIMDGMTEWKSLAVVISDPVEIIGARKGMMFRAVVEPPLPK